MRIVFFDLETGGLDPLSHPITQIGAIAVDEQLNELEVFQCKLTFHEGVCDEKALAMNGYNETVWAKEAISPLQACGQFGRFLSRYADIERMSEKTQNPYRVAQLAGYNAATFDGPFIQQFFKQERAFLPASYQVLDVLQRAKWHFHELGIAMPSLKLSAVAEHFGIKVENAHDALADVRTTIAVYKAMRTVTFPLVSWAKTDQNIPETLRELAEKAKTSTGIDFSIPEEFKG